MPFSAEYRAQLASHDRHFAWKLSIRTLLILANITTAGLIGWATANGLRQYGDSYYFWDTNVIPWAFIPVGASLIFCLTVLLINLLRKRPVHPGVEVGIDLVLWLAFAILAGFTIVTAVELVNDRNSYSTDGTGSSDGYYTTAANGSSVYVTPNNRDDCPRFDSCTDQSSFVDSITHRGVVELTAGALMILSLILHFALFVWACVDTAARNSQNTHQKAKEIADAMIAEMVARGQLPPPRQPLLVPSQRGSQVASEMSRENSAVFMTPATAYYAPQGGASCQGHTQMSILPEAQSLALSQDAYMAGQQGPGSASAPASGAAAPQQAPLQPARSEGSSSQNGNGNGWHTPPLQSSIASAPTTDEVDPIRPIPPVRAPGHTYSPRGSVSQISPPPSRR